MSPVGGLDDRRWTRRGLIDIPPADLWSVRASTTTNVLRPETFDPGGIMADMQWSADGSPVLIPSVVDMASTSPLETSSRDTAPTVSKAWPGEQKSF